MYHPPPQQTVQYVVPPQQGFYHPQPVVVVQQPQPVYVVQPQVQVQHIYQSAPAPCLHIVKAVYGKGNRTVDVTDKLQQVVMNKGGWTLSEFGYWFKPNGKMNEMFGDPCPGVDKDLHITYEIVGSVKRAAVEEDKKICIDMEEEWKRTHTHTHTTVHTSIGHHHHSHGHHHHFHSHHRGGRHHHHHHHHTTPHVDVTTHTDPVPSSVRSFVLDVVRATYGIDGHAADVTSTVGAMVAKQRGKRLSEFGYIFSPNGGMNKAFGDPCPGRDKWLTIEYRWRTPQLTLCVSEDRKVDIDFSPLKQFL